MPRRSERPTVLPLRRSGADVAPSVERVAAIAKQRGVSRAQVALAWVFSKSAITAPIVGATKPQHMEDALAAVSLKLTADEIKALEEPYVPHGVAGHS